MVLGVSLKGSCGVLVCHLELNLNGLNPGPPPYDLLKAKLIPSRSALRPGRTQKPGVDALGDGSKSRCFHSMYYKFRPSPQQPTCLQRAQCEHSYVCTDLKVRNVSVAGAPGLICFRQGEAAPSCLQILSALNPPGHPGKILVPFPKGPCT